MPVITSKWGLSLNGGESSPCNYNRGENRYCVPLKTVAMSSGTKKVVNPHLGFTVRGACQLGDGDVELEVRLYKYANETKPITKDLIATLPTKTKCLNDGSFEAKTASRQYHSDSLFIISEVLNTRSPELGPLMAVTVEVAYSSGWWGRGAEPGAPH